MLKILFKAAVLFLIVISVYLIVNPHACSNMLSGRERVAPVDGTADHWRHPMAEPGPAMLPPQKDPQATDEMLEITPEEKSVPATAYGPQAQPAYSQADIDYAIAKRYVELEQEYADNQQAGKDKSRELSYIVMQDFEVTPAEWNAFLARATATDLFEKVRQAQAAEKEAVN